MRRSPTLFAPARTARRISGPDQGDRDGETHPAEQWCEYVLQMEGGGRLFLEQSAGEVEMDRLVGLCDDGQQRERQRRGRPGRPHVERVPPSRHLTSRTEGELPRTRRRPRYRSADQRADRLNRAEVLTSQPGRALRARTWRR